MKTLAIVTHCFCPPGLDIYAEHLRWQWASLVNYPATRASVTLFVCCANSDEDPATWGTLCEMTFNRRPACIKHVFPLGELFRRAIGRNRIAKDTERPFDVFWFADVDYLFGAGCLDAVAELVGPDDTLCSPEYVNISVDHATGQRIVDEARGKPVPPIPVETFARRRQKVAIGGCQIVGGNVMRRIGYCEGTKWVKPVDPAAGFRSCRCDRAFRHVNGFRAKKLPIPGVYRLRHERAGRDVSLAGEVLGRKVW